MIASESRAEFKLEEAAQPTDGFYVSVVDGGRIGLALGPFDSHADAEQRVDEVRAYVREHDTSPRSAFYAFGTVKVGDCRIPGKLNGVLA